MNTLRIAFILFLSSNLSVALAQNVSTEILWPNTPSSVVMQDFIKAYNTGELGEVEKFVIKHYYANDKTETLKNVEEWMDLYHRYGPIKPHSISINKEFDTEVWMQGRITKIWFAVEFILDKESGKVSAVGLLEGEKPKDVSQPFKNPEDLLRGVEAYLVKNEEKKLFQGVVLIQKNQETIFKNAYGMLNDSLGIKNSIATRMRISSITKPITVIACLQLVQNGYLEFDSPISIYLPELPLRVSSNITMRSLIMHTSGYELDGISEFREKLEETNSMEEVYQLHLEYLPKWEKYKTFNPKGNYDYSNDSFDLLAILIEKVTGMKFEDYIKENVFEVSNMNNTSFSTEDVALPYRYDIKPNGITDYSSYYPFSLGGISGAGGLKSTVEDLTNLFNTLYYSDKLLDSPFRNLMFSLSSESSSSTDPDVGPSPLNNQKTKFNKDPKVKNGRSMGFQFIYDTNLSVGHNGTSIGNSAELRYFPHAGYLIMVLCNNRSGAQNFFQFFNNSIPKN